jgi:hypothetical protein
MKSFKDDEILSGYSLYSEFNVNLHKKKYFNYLEVVIDKDGNIQYAVPSHSEKLIDIIMKTMNIDRTTLYDMVPKKYHFSLMEWLVMKANAVAVWTNCVYYYSINEKQIEKLKMLKEEGVYMGLIPAYETIQHF